MLTPINFSEGYDDGASTIACNNMLPQHAAVSLDLPSPYRISCNQTSFKPGQTIAVYIQTDIPETTFRGFLVEARDTFNRSVGRFMPSDGVKLLNCNNGQNVSNSYRLRGAPWSKTKKKNYFKFPKITKPK